jgi:predicted molibdopterin-dependent oxidoreductase YjgC
MALAGHARFLALYPAANSRRARAMGLVKGLPAVGADVAFVYAGDAPVGDAAVAELRAAKFLAVSATCANALTRAADVVLPAPGWAERNGSFVNLEGNTLSVAATLPPPAGVRTEAELLAAIGTRI